MNPANLSLIPSRNILFLLTSGFEDPCRPGQLFYCWECALIEGVLALFPRLTEEIEIRRVAWPRPRKELVDLVGESNQSLPLLVLREQNQIRPLQGYGPILTALSDLYGIPRPYR